MKKHLVKNTFLPQDIAILAAIFGAGALCLFLGEGWVAAGVMILMCGAMLAPFFLHGYRIKGQKGLFRLKEIPLSRDNKDEILAYLDGKTERLDLKPAWKSGGALVDVYYRKGHDKMLARYFDYADFLQGKEYPLCDVSQAQVTALASYRTDKKYK